MLKKIYIRQIHKNSEKISTIIVKSNKLYKKSTNFTKFLN